jgi:hypothetical protein
VRDVDNEAATASDHACRGKLAGVIVRADTGAEHRVPPPQRLLPERLHPGELAVVHHPLVAAPYVVDEDVDGVVLCDARERGFDVAVHGVIAANADGAFADGLEIRFRTSGDEDLRALPGQFTGDTTADAAAPSCDESDLTV